jgi:hypothetical protein
VIFEDFRIAKTKNDGRSKMEAADCSWKLVTHREATMNVKHEHFSEILVNSHAYSRVLLV